MKRIYSKEMTVGSVYEKDGKTTAVVNLGGLGKFFFNIKGEDDKGNWDLTKTIYGKDGEKEIKVGKAFKNDKYDFIRTYRIGLSSKWNKENEREETDNENQIVLTFIMLKEPIPTKSGSKKIAYIKSAVAIVPREEKPASEDMPVSPEVPADTDVDDEDIPF